MIKYNDLRIGNLFYPIDRSATVHLPTRIPFEIVELNAFNVSAIVFGENPAQVERWPEFPYSDLSPIELNHEILERFGFLIEHDCSSKKVDDDGFLFLEVYPDGKAALAAEINCMTYSIPLNAHVRSLHQLQNLYYSLTLKELTGYLLNKDQNVQECDATKADSSTSAGGQIPSLPDSKWRDMQDAGEEK